MYTEECILWSATVSYPLEQEEYKVNFNFGPSQIPSVLSNYTSPGDQSSAAPGSRVGLVLGTRALLTGLLGTDATLLNTGTRWSVSWLASTFLHVNHSRETCNSYFNRPTIGILWGIRSWVTDVVWEFGIEKTTVNGTRTLNTPVYKRKFGFLAAGVLLRVVGLMATLPLLWGWVELERGRTLSPLETSRAFGAPMLSDGTGSYSTTDELVKEIGAHEVVYVNGRFSRR